MPRRREEQKCAGFVLGKNGRRIYPHRCNNPRGQRGRGRRLCMARATFDHWKEHPRCARCGSSLHWAIDVYRASETEKRHTTCRDARCPYDYPHQFTARECVNNPKRPSDPFELSDEAAIKNDGDEPGW